MKKLIVFLALFSLLCGCFAGCKNTDNSPAITPTEPTAEPKEFVVDGVHIDLDDSFKDYTQEGYYEDLSSQLVGNGKWELLIDKHKKPVEGVTTLEEYAKKQQTELTSLERTSLISEAVQKDGIWTLIYQNDNLNETHTCLCIFIESEDSFCTITARCPEDVFETYKPEMWEKLKSGTVE